MSLKEKGLSMVEIVMALVVLAILASTAIPSFVNSGSDANRAAVEGVAGSLGSAAAINYAVRSINKANGITISNCIDVANTLEGSLGKDYSIIASHIDPDETAQCTVVHHSGEKATFMAQGTR